MVAGFGSARHDLRERFAGLLAEVDHWQAVTRALAATVAHLDCWANNLIVTPKGDPVLIDWSFCGVGVVGEDPGNLVLDGFLDHFFEPEEYPEVDAAVWSAYASGLEESGWPHAMELARLGMCVAAMKFLWLPALMVRNAGFTGPTGYGGRGRSGSGGGLQSPGGGVRGASRSSDRGSTAGRAPGHPGLIRCQGDRHVVGGAGRGWAGRGGPVVGGAARWSQPGTLAKFVGDACTRPGRDRPRSHCHA